MIPRIKTSVWGKTPRDNPDNTGIPDVFLALFDSMAEGDRVELRGLSSFYVKKYKSYMGWKPKTGEKVNITPEEKHYI